MSAQDRTIDQYHNWMQVNAASHVIRAGRRLGILGLLRERQHTADQIVEGLSLQSDATVELLDALVAIGYVEQYGDDYALSQAAQLLCQYDEDLGDGRWEGLIDHVAGRTDRKATETGEHLDYLAATQWIHTKAAMQAAEILDVGGEGEVSGPMILDLGCGSAVWSCAMAHRDPEARVTAVDHPAALEAATSTAASIDMLQRFQAQAGDPLSIPLPSAKFDLVLVAQRISCLDEQAGEALLTRAREATAPGGRVVVIDSFRGPARPSLAESTESLMLRLRTSGGSLRTVDQIQDLLGRMGWKNVQFTFLADSKIGLAMVVGTRPSGLEK